MTSTSSSADPATRWKGPLRITSIALRVLLSVAFIGAGLFKLSGNPAAIAEFDRVGFGQGLRFLTAVMELTGAMLLLVPRTVPYGAILMGTVCVGAVFAQAYALHGDVVHAVVLAVVLAAIAWLHRGRLAIGR